MAKEQWRNEVFVNEIFSSSFAFLFFCFFAIKLDFGLKAPSTHLELCNLLNHYSLALWYYDSPNLRLTTRRCQSNILDISLIRRASK